MKGRAGPSLPPCPQATRWVSTAKPMVSWVPLAVAGPGTADRKEKMLFPVCTFPSCWLRDSGTAGPDRAPFPVQRQAQVLVPLTAQLCSVPDTPGPQPPPPPPADTAQPARARPAEPPRGPESWGMDSVQKQDLRRPKIHGAGRASPYQPPTLASLQRLLWVRRAPTLNHVNEVWPNLFLGDAYAARDKSRLMQMGVTHVVNAAAGRFQVDTGAKFYHGLPLDYYGVEADDNPYFDISIYFLPVARYIRAALSAPRGELLGWHRAGRAAWVWGFPVPQ
uniref:Dual specificity phosphatase 13B n=1 Tax=Chinchilla lanigera TaxID=34839 RepID=A0A8C2VJV5_CHILA